MCVAIHLVSVFFLLCDLYVGVVEKICYDKSVMKKQWLLPLIAVLVVLGGIIGTVVYLSQPVSSESDSAPTPTLPPEKVNIIPLEERPYAAITPSKNGLTITLTLGALKKDAKEGEYELDYQFGNNLQNGAFGIITVDELPGAEFDILLGSCSAGGKCSYDENVSGGSLLLRFEDPEKYVLKNEWAFIDNAKKESVFTSRDAKFGVEGAGLATVPFAVILQSPGLPENVTQSVLSDPYSVRLATVAKGPFTIRMRMKEANASAQMLGWDGKSWVELDTQVEEKAVEAQSPTLYEAYVVVGATE